MTLLADIPQPGIGLYNNIIDVDKKFYRTGQFGGGWTLIRRLSVATREMKFFSSFFESSKLVRCDRKLGHGPCGMMKKMMVMMIMMMVHGDGDDP